MKIPSVIFRWASIIGLAAASLSCMTTYDSAGRPVQSVDPGVALAGAAAAGLIGYAIANDDDHKHKHHHYHGGYYRPPHCGPYRRW